MRRVAIFKKLSFSFVVFAFHFSHGQYGATVAPTAAPDGASNKAAPVGQTSIQGTPKYVRQNPVAEVFFSDLPQSYVIPEGPSKARWVNRFMDAADQKQRMNFHVDPQKRMIMSVAGDSSSLQNLNANFSSGSNQGNQDAAPKAPKETQTGNSR